ncbi:MAG: gliding motility-associated C-terminal domain-containing protein, partial [Bacteroidia bacterium]|nr:gliding motility-associated C-terminal domain-containing protein [Bacteroidia bacterium]
RDKEILILDAGAFRHYLWEPGNDSLRVKEFYQPIKQRLTVIDNNHCSSSKEIDIVSWCEDYFYLPNAFTPTRDGLNETFQPVMNNGVFYEMQIFNRWGDLLYSTRDINQGWDGTYNGQASPSGVYIVTISYSQKNSLQQKSKSANFTLLR